MYKVNLPPSSPRMSFYPEHPDPSFHLYAHITGRDDSNPEGFFVVVVLVANLTNEF